MVLVCFTGCQKRCSDWDLGWVKLGMYESYTPGPVPLLDETIFHYTGPDYPQKSIATRIEESLLRQYPAGGFAAPLVAALTKQYFTCVASEVGVKCHLSVMVLKDERCHLLEETRHYKLKETVDILIGEADGRVKTISAVYDMKEVSR